MSQSNLAEKEMLLDALDAKVDSQNSSAHNAPIISSQVPSGDANANAAAAVGVLKFDRRRKVLKKSASYNPATWKPMYDAIIMDLVIFGSKKKDIAARFKVTPQTVSNIINCEQGKIKIRAAQERVRETMIRSIPQRMGDIAEKFVNRMEEFAADDTLYEKSPFAVIDRGMRFMQGTRLLSVQDNVNTSPASSLPAVSEKAMDRLSHALERINESINPPQQRIGA
jgi:hypothetical protein